MGRPKQKSFLKSCDVGKTFIGEHRLEIPYDPSDKFWVKEISLAPKLDPAFFSSAEHFVFTCQSDDFLAYLLPQSGKVDLRHVTSGCIVPMHTTERSATPWPLPTATALEDTVPALHVSVSGRWEPGDGNTHETFIAEQALVTYGFLENPLTKPGSVYRPIYETAWLRKIGTRLNRLLPPPQRLEKKSEIKDGTLIITQKVPCYRTDGPLEYAAQEHLLSSETQYLLLHAMWNSWEQRGVKVEIRREELTLLDFPKCQKGAFSTMCKRAGLPGGKQRPRKELLTPVSSGFRLVLSAV